MLAGEISTKNIHPIHALLLGADRNPSIGIKFHDNLHLSDFPNSINYPDFGTSKYYCNMKWNCPICNFYAHTIKVFNHLQNLVRRTNRFQVSELADSERNWDIDELTYLKDTTEMIELSNLTLMTAAMAADMDRIQKIKDIDQLKKEKLNVEIMKQQIVEMTLQHQQANDNKDVAPSTENS